MNFWLSSPTKVENAYDPPQLTEAHQYQIEPLKKAIINQKVIANLIGVSVSTISRELKGNTGKVFQLSFPVTSTNAFDTNGQKLDITQLQELLQQVVAPKLADLKIDLNESRDDIIRTLLPYVPAEDSEQLHDSVNSLRFNNVKADATSIVLNLGFMANIKPANTAPVAASYVATLTTNPIKIHNK